MLHSSFSFTKPVNRFLSKSSDVEAGNHPAVGAVGPPNVGRSLNEKEAELRANNLAIEHHRKLIIQVFCQQVEPLLKSRGMTSDKLKEM